MLKFTDGKDPKKYEIDTTSMANMREALVKAAEALDIKPDLVPRYTFVYRAKGCEFMVSDFKYWKQRK